MEIGERNEKGWKSKNFNNLKNLKIYFENQRILKIGEKCWTIRTTRILKM